MCYPAALAAGLLGKAKAALHGALGAAAVEHLAGPLGHIFGVGDVAVLVLEAGQVAALDLGADQALDGLELVHVFGGEQNDGLAAGAGARGAADAVDVVFGLGRYVVVDDVRDAVVSALIVTLLFASVSSAQTPAPNQTELMERLMLRIDQLEKRVAELDPPARCEPQPSNYRPKRSRRVR